MRWNNKNAVVAAFGFRSLSSAYRYNTIHHPTASLLRTTHSTTKKNGILSNHPCSSISSTIIAKMTTTNNNNENKINIETKQIPLSTNILAEIKQCQASSSTKTKSNLPPLVFIHGSFHAAWCWTERYFEYFCTLGYNCYALSLRGTGTYTILYYIKSIVSITSLIFVFFNMLCSIGGTFAGENVKKVKIKEHINDLSSFLNYVAEQEQQSSNNKTPILISHSFGGLIVMKYLEQISLIKFIQEQKNNDDIGSLKGTVTLEVVEKSRVILNTLPHVKPKGVVLMCSVPPSGNTYMTLRFLKRSLRDSWKITKGLALKKCIGDGDLARTLFFADDKEDVDGVTQEDLERYQGYFKRDTVGESFFVSCSYILGYCNLIIISYSLPSQCLMNIHTTRQTKTTYKATIDLGDFSSKLPTQFMKKETGLSAFVNYLPDALVVGAKNDFLVDAQGVEETANWFGVEPIFVDSPHDVSFFVTCVIVYMYVYWFFVCYCRTTLSFSCICFIVDLYILQIVDRLLFVFTLQE